MTYYEYRNRGALYKTEHKTGYLSYFEPRVLYDIIQEAHLDRWKEVPAPLGCHFNSLCHKWDE